MKNSPHHRRHMQHKAIQAAVQIQPKGQKAPLKTPLPINDFLRPLNINRCINALHLYKKHLEQASLYRHQIDVTQKKSNRYAAHTQSSDLERSKRIARKMLKESHQYYKKAA